MRRLAFALLLAAACGSSDSKQSSAGSAPAGSAGSAAPAGSAGSGYAAQGKKPANARRATPPPEIEKSALAVGAKAPEVTLPDVRGGTWTLAGALAKHARVMVFFYRGDW